MDFPAVVEKLTVIIEGLTNEIAILKDRITHLEGKNKVLRQENDRLRKENARLKERLGLNSTNSSLPPSRDLYRTKRHSRPKSNRSPGAQAGHKPHFYQLQTPDEVIDVFPEACSCGSLLEIGSTFHVEQRIEILPLKPHVTEYRLS